MKRTVEFWCSTGGGGCGGYFSVRLRTNIDGKYTVVCPECKHEHNRNIVKGEITNSRCNELSRKSNDREVIIVPSSAYTKESVLENMASPSENSRVVKDDEEDKMKKIIRRDFLWSRFSGRGQ